jgi:hypothetical protein
MGGQLSDDRENFWRENDPTKIIHVYGYFPVHVRKASSVRGNHNKHVISLLHKDTIHEIAGFIVRNGKESF